MSKQSEGRYAYEGLDRVIHEKARLAILTCLISYPKGLAFGELRRFCKLTAGNLRRHLQVLEEAGMVSIEKSFVDNRPHTACSLTTAGRQRYADYLAVLEQVVRDAAAAVPRASLA